MDSVNINTKVAEGSAPIPLLATYLEPVTRKPGQTATHAVLFTPELLCNIISQLPIADIITTTGVCHFWRDAVAADPQVQKALFLKPAEVRWVLVHKTLPVSNIEQLFFQHNPGNAIPEELCYTIGHMNPFLYKICGVVNGHYSEFEDDLSALDFGHHNGSWRDMFISQPPCKIIKFFLEARCEGALHEIEFRYTNQTGVRLGGLQNGISFALRKAMKSGTSHNGVRKPFLLKIKIQNYCEENFASLSGTMQLPAHDGLAVFPETMVWKPAA